MRPNTLPDLILDGNYQCTRMGDGQSRGTICKVLLELGPKSSSIKASAYLKELDLGCCLTMLS